LFQWIEPTSLFVYRVSSACLHWTESTPSRSASLVLINLRLCICFFTFALLIVLQTSAMSTTARKLNERNYRKWAIEAKALLRAQGLWQYISGEMGVPRPPIAATSDASTTSTAHDPRDTGYDFLPESTGTSYLNHFYLFLRHWERCQMNNDKACAQLTSLMESRILIWY
jgi:hypothetical protein